MSKISPQKAQNEEAQATEMKIILSVSFIMGIITSLLPQESINGNPVPIIIFKGHPSIFQAFLICIMFSFSGSFCYLMIENKQKFGLAKFCRCYSIISMVLALSIIAYALVLDGLNWVKIMAE